MSNICLNNNIGLSKITCNCPAFASKPVQVSGSGFYVDDELSLQDFVYADCGQGNIWDILQAAKDKAILDFKTDFQAELGKSYKSKVTPFADEIGLRAYSGFNTTASKYCGLRIDLIGGLGQKFVLKSVNIGNNLGGATTLKIWRGYSQWSTTVQNIELITSFPITLLANQFTNYVLSTPLEIELKQYEVYFITYDLPTNSFPFNNTFPNCSSCQNANIRYNEIIKIGGISTDTETLIKDQNFGQLSAFGLVIDAQLYCDVSQWFCRLEKLGSIDGNYMVTSKALVYKSAINAVQTLLDNNQINFTTLTSRESLYGKRSHFQKEYEYRLQYLASQFPISDYNCMTCGTERVKVQSILT